MSQDRSAEQLFIEAMRELRGRRGWSQERLAEEVKMQTGMHINPSSITKLEWVLDPQRTNKARGLRLNEAYAIALTFDSNVGLMASPNREQIDPGARMRELFDQLKILRAEEALAQQQVDLAHLQVVALTAELENLAKFEALEDEPKPVDDREDLPRSEPGKGFVGEPLGVWVGGPTGIVMRTNSAEYHPGAPAEVYIPPAEYEPTDLADHLVPAPGEVARDGEHSEAP